jgi:hypothetical protein
MPPATASESPRIPSAHRAARNLGAGRGISISEDGVEYRPLTLPPLYPVAIAATPGRSITDAARWLAVALFGARRAGACW